MTNRPETISQNLRCPLTDPEKIRFGESLARLLEEMGEVEDEQKATASQFKAQLEGIEKAVTKARKVLTAGYEYRWIDCKVLYHDPLARNKTIVRLDTGEIVRVEDMTEEECQEKLPLAEPAKESLLSVPMGSDGAQEPSVPSAGQGNDEQLFGSIPDGRPQGGDEPERAAPAPRVDPSIALAAAASAEQTNGAKRKRRSSKDPQTQTAGYPA